MLQYFICKSVDLTDWSRTAWNRLHSDSVRLIFSVLSRFQSIIARKGDSSRLEIDSTSFLQRTQNSFHEAVKENVNESIQSNRSTHFFFS